MDAGFDCACADSYGNVYTVGGAVRIAYSSDHSETWSNSVMISDPAVKSKSPKVACDDSGHVYVIWQGYFDWNVYFNCSSDYGLIWLPQPIQINEGLSDYVIDDNYEPTSYNISCDNSGNVYVGWLPKPAITSVEAPLFRMSPDYGKTWQKKQRMRFFRHSDPGRLAVGPMKMVNDEFGRVAIMWREGNEYISLNFSQDCGRTWLGRAIPFGRYNYFPKPNLFINDSGLLAAIWEAGTPVSGWGAHGTTLQFSTPTFVGTNSYMSEK